MRYYGTFTLITVFKMIYYLFFCSITIIISEKEEGDDVTLSVLIQTRS